MKKRMLSLFLAGIMAAGTMACGSSSDSAAPEAPQETVVEDSAEEVTGEETTPAEDTTAADESEYKYSFDVNNVGEHNFTFASTSAAESVGEQVTDFFAQRVEELSGGKMTVTHFGGSALGTESQYLEALTAGTLDMGMIAVEFYCNSIPQLGAMLLPYMYEDYDQVTNVLMSEAGDYANEQILEVADCVNLSYFIQAFRQIYSTREIKSADDLKGVKIRVPESSLYVDTFEMMGAAPTPLPLSEVYTAMDTGVVNAVENIPDTAVHNSWAEVAPYMIETNHMNGPSTFSMSNKVYSTLNEDEQNILLQAGYETVYFAVALSEEKDAEARAVLEEDMTIIQPDIQSMRDAMDYTKYDFMQSEEAQKLFELVQANLQ